MQTQLLQTQNGVSVLLYFFFISVHDNPDLYCQYIFYKCKGSPPPVKFKWSEQTCEYWLSQKNCQSSWFLASPVYTRTEDGKCFSHYYVFMCHIIFLLKMRMSRELTLDVKVRAQNIEKKTLTQNYLRVDYDLLHIHFFLYTLPFSPLFLFDKTKQKYKIPWITFCLYFVQNKKKSWLCLRIAWNVHVKWICINLSIAVVVVMAPDK